MDSNLAGNLLNTHACCVQSLDLLDFRQRDVQPALFPLLGPLGMELEHRLESFPGQADRLEDFGEGSVGVNVYFYCRESFPWMELSFG